MRGGQIVTDRGDPCASREKLQASKSTRLLLPSAVDTERPFLRSGWQIHSDAELGKQEAKTRARLAQQATAQRRCLKVLLPTVALRAPRQSMRR